MAKIMVSLINSTKCMFDDTAVIQSPCHRKEALEGVRIIMSSYFLVLQCFIVLLFQLFSAECKTDINPQLFTKSLIHFAKAHRPAVVLQSYNEALSEWNLDLLTLIILYEESTDHSVVIKRLGRLIEDGEIDFIIFWDVGHRNFARVAAEEVRLFSSKVSCFLDMRDSDAYAHMTLASLLFYYSQGGLSGVEIYESYRVVRHFIDQAFVNIKIGCSD